jgi:type IV pilus assembly protein PilE
MKSEKGLTLIELLAVVAIVGILGAIAIPSYNNYMQRARRSDAKTALEHVRAAQEMWRAEKGRYATDGGGSTAEERLRNTMGVSTATVSTHYTWSFSVKTTSSYTAQAIPRGSQTSDRGGTLFIDHNGAKWSVYSGTRRDYPNSECGWSR